MKRFIAGIVLLSFFALGVLGCLTDPTLSGEDLGYAILGGGLIFGLPGGLLVYYGKRFRDLEKMILNDMCTMLRTQERIDASALSVKYMIGQFQIQQILYTAQRKGIVPFGVNVK